MAKKKQKREGWYNTLRNRLGHYILGAVLVIAGPIVSLYYIGPVLEGRACANWPTTKGVITEAKLVETSRGPFQSFETKVGYTYKVDGQPFTGNRLKIGGKPSSDEATAQADMKRYGRIDAIVDVRYNPADPSRSTLETGGSGTDFLMVAAAGPGILVFGVFLIAVGGLMSFLARRKPDDDEDPDEDETPRKKKQSREEEDEGQASAEEDDEDAPPKKKGQREAEDRPRKKK